MSVLTIILFFLYFYGFGYTVINLSKVKESKGFEKHAIRLGFGIPAFITVGVLLNLVNIPLYWFIFLIPFLYTLYDTRNKFKIPKISKKYIKKLLNKKTLIFILLIFLFAGNLYMYTTGSFAYEYLEDDDPWTHAREMKYISIEKTLDVDYTRPVNYLDPYPPAYSLIMGILHQTSEEAQWTLKFFNSLLISLSIIFFFFLVQALTKNDAIALSSTFILSMLPSYLSHFIWSHSLIPFLFFLLIFSYTTINKRNWWILTTITTSGIFLTHSRQVIKLAILAAIFFGFKWLYTKKVPKKIFKATVVGFIISLSWWAFKFTDFIRMITESGRNARIISETLPETTGMFTKLIKKIPLMFSPTGGSATRAYTFHDFFTATSSNHINSPVGWGMVITVLLAVGLFILLLKFKSWKKQRWIPIVLLWFIITFLLVNSATFNLPIGLAAFRTWMLLAIPVSIITGYAIYWIISLKYPLVEIKYLLFIAIVVGIILTSGIPKFLTNTSPSWSAGGKWGSFDELSGYLWMKENLPLNTKILSYSSQTKVMIGINMFACVWCEEFRDFKIDILEKDMNVVHTWVVENRYQYIVFGGMERKYLGNESADKITEELNEQSIPNSDELGKIRGHQIANQLIDQRIQEANDSKKFAVVYNNLDFVLFEVK